MLTSLRLPPPVGAFLTWWWNELSGMWPGRRDLTDPEKDAWDLTSMAQQLALQAGRDGARYLIDPDEADAERPEGLKAPSAPVVLRLDPELAIVQELELPLATEEGLDRVIAYQMDRETPFTADRVFYNFRVLARDRVSKQLRVELAVVPRRTLEPVLDRLQRWGVPLQAALLHADGAVFDLLPADRRATASRWPRLINATLLTVALALVATGLSLPLLGKQRTLAQLEPQVVTARKGALTTNQLRDEIQQLRERLDFAVNEKRSRIQLLEVVAEVTRLLPDDTWLTELEVTGSEVQMRGETPNAAQLVGLFESSKRLGNARFRSPVTQVPGGQRERFHLSVDVQPEGAS